MSHKEQQKANITKTSIGGQAVLEGVMMRGQSAMATAVRDGDGIIRLESTRITPQQERNFIFKLPLVRGVFSFISSLVTGTKVLMRSADVYGEGEPSRFEKWVSNKLKINVMSVVSTLSLLIGLALAIFLFMWLPQFTREGIEKLVGNEFTFGLWAKNFIEGGLKLLIFIGYILLVSLLKDIKKTYMYHGAEHKTISCYESGMDLTVENVKKCTRVHDRCGTTFIVFVMVISILSFAVLESLIGGVDKFYRVLLKIAMLPLVAGLSYELLKLLAKTKSVFVLPLKAPGLLLQRITTREPNDDMIEVAITAFKTVMEMDNDKTIPEREFVVAEKRCELLSKVRKQLFKYGIEESAEAEWIVSLTIGCKRNQLNSEKFVSPKYVEEVMRITRERCTGRPLWYCIGDTDFYGYKIFVDEKVLIPRPETELLVENALKFASEDKKVLDLCTGSGAIAVAVKKESNANLTAVDISDGALEVAKKNADFNQAEIEFIKSDLFEQLTDRKFDLIISNPPYIASEDIEKLQLEVRDFEPTLALDGGADGYCFYRRIASEAKNHLNENGVLLLECGIGQAQTICDMLKEFKSVEIIKDYENIDRIVKAVL